MYDCKLQGGMGEQEGFNARFWIFYRDGWVKVTLRPNQRLDITSGGPTEEGYHGSYESYVHEGDHIESSVGSWGRDCDGRYETDSVMYCPLNNLLDGEPGLWDERRPESIAGVKVPDWRVKDRRQRDYTAEAAGY